MAAEREIDHRLRLISGVMDDWRGSRVPDGAPDVPLDFDPHPAASMLELGAAASLNRRRPR
jgi:hypothetical protein